jgi:UDP-N-acetylmuramoyl-L-alanyl-D-glutamate--2,6-diaminopimelate ligase
MTLRELIAGFDLRLSDSSGASDPRICDISEDSRTVMPGTLFVARPGLESDGRKYIAEAVRGGAVAILTTDFEAVPERLRDRVAILTSPRLEMVVASLAERFFGEPSRSLSLVGVTGTNGKTTITHVLHALLNATGRRCGLIGTVSVDDGRDFSAAELTTPPALEVSRTLSQMVESGCVAAALEVSSHALKQGRTAALHFDVGVFTNLTGDHLDYHGDMESYADCKAELFLELPQDATAIINIDDPWSNRMIEACSCSVIRCSARIESGADAVVEVVEESMAGARLRLGSPWGNLEATTRLVGKHNAMNVLQAALSAQAVGVEAAEIAEALRHCQPPPGRLETVTAPGAPFALFVDYAHTDDALRNVLAAARPLVPAEGRLTVVFGCGGDRDRSKRPRMANVACELADRVYITSDNPRTEDPEGIVAEIMQGVPYERRQVVTRRTDRALAIREAVANAKPGDLLIIAGKGHEDNQIVADGMGGSVKLPFDDREHARAALAEIGVPAVAIPQAPLVEEPPADALDVLQLWDDTLSSLELREP